ncbi:MAG: hypothetical protein Q9162_002685 [Coniocarpon cinnabarinum]
MKLLLTRMEHCGIDLDSEDHQGHVQVLCLQPEPWQLDHLPEDVHVAIKVLWADSGVKQAYRRRHEFGFSDSIELYAGDIDRLAASSYVPSDHDVLMSRVQTLGIEATTFNRSAVPHISDRPTWKVFDVSGARSERRKWALVSDKVDLVIFSVDLTSYDKSLPDDKAVNGMEEALTVFDTVYNSHFFVDTAFVLLFTKDDQLAPRMTENPPHKYFNDFKADGNPIEWHGAFQMFPCRDSLSLP